MANQYNMIMQDLYRLARTSTDPELKEAAHLAIGALNKVSKTGRLGNEVKPMYDGADTPSTQGIPSIQS